jgi:hypothetical protein
MTFLAPVSTPGTYEFQVADLLHDPTLNRWTEAQIDGYINEARKQCVMDTGCLRTLQNSFVTGGVEQYTFGAVDGGVILAPGSGYSNPQISFSGGGGSGVAAAVSQSGGAVNAISFSNFGSGYTSAPAATITDTGAGVGATAQVGIISVLTYDILSINLIWGTERYTLQWYPWRLFSAWYRPFLAASYQRQPVAWAVYGDASIFVGPCPDQSYAIEVDSIILPTPYAVGDTTTVDAIPPMSQDPIKFYAAYLAKNNAQNYGEANQFLEQYQRRVKEVTSVYTGRLPDVYSG